MLCLQRLVDQEIVINGNIVVKIVGVKRGKVTMGIDAPREVSVYRREVYDEIQRDIDAANRNDGTPTGWEA